MPRFASHETPSTRARPRPGVPIGQHGACAITSFLAGRVRLPRVTVLSVVLPVGSDQAWGAVGGGGRLALGERPGNSLLA